MLATRHHKRLVPEARRGLVRPDAREVLVAVNPSAGAGSKRRAVDGLVQALERRDLKVRLVSGQQQLASELHRDGLVNRLRCIVAAGGDGTVSGVANQAPGVPLALFPLGTENLLARYLGVTRDPVTTAEVIARGWVRRCDLPSANGRYFTLMAGLGFDAEIVHQVARRRRGNLVRSDYGKPILEALRNYTYPELFTWVDLNPTPIRCRLAFVFNLPCYGLGLPLAPEARGDDGFLDLVLFEGGSTRKLLRYLWAVLMGKHARLPDVHTVRARRVRFEAPQKVPVQLDGDPFGWTPLEITLESQMIEVMVPVAEPEGNRT